MLRMMFSVSNVIDKNSSQGSLPSNPVVAVRDVVPTATVEVKATYIIFCVLGMGMPNLIPQRYREYVG